MEVEGDAVSIAMSDIISVAQEKWSSKEGSNHRLNSKTHTSQGPQVITQLSLRIQALKKSGAIDVSPWDGMTDFLTAELTNPSNSFLSHSNHIEGSRICKDQSDYDDGGVSKLIGVFLVLLADDDAWERASAALRSIDDIISRRKRLSGEMDDSRSDEKHEDASPNNIGSEDEVQSEANDDDDELSRTDDITASVLLSSLANLSDKQCEELQKCALSAGRGGHDPWRALLFYLVRLDYSNRDDKQVAKRIKTRQGSTTARESIPWTLIFEATNSAICDRLNKSIEGEMACESLIHDLANQHMKSGKNHGDESYGEEELSVEDGLEAINVVNILRGIEKDILVQAVEILNMSSQELVGEVQLSGETK
ncbi:hypothetical protein ACHAXA_003551 [Cyclostephanos tholiformis]|uniref:Uncharacterized protein n=1 Tax=Cyclostephanos tholiformis TaxID=382380 RepID=A0ABD3R5W8_9STRA